VTGWLSDALPGEPRRSIGAVLLVQALASAVLFGVVATVGSTLPTALAFVALGFFILGCTGVYYSCLATLVPAEAIGGATAGGQLALTTGALVTPPVFGYLSETAGYLASWSLLGGLAVVAAVFVGRVIVTEPPAGATAVEPAEAD
jgi:sugar phosphate permease